jgi:hypothetical protein
MLVPGVLVWTPPWKGGDRQRWRFVPTFWKIWLTMGPRKMRATITMIAMRARSRPYSTSV